MPTPIDAARSGALMLQPAPSPAQSPVLLHKEDISLEKEDISLENRSKDRAPAGDPRGQIGRKIDFSA